MKTLVWHVACCIAVLIALSPQLLAEVRVFKDFGDDEGLTLYKMTVTAAAEPTPVFKHRLQLGLHELKPGNAATYYLQANAVNNLGTVWKSVRKEFGEAVEEWCRSEIPPNELPLDKVRKAASRFDSIVSNCIAPASNRQDCDWGYNFAALRGPEVIALLLPGAQQSREICRMLLLRTTLAIAEGRYDDAIDHIRMNYRLARNVGQEPILICGLIGIAEASITNRTVLDLIAAPGSPNLYWALAELPNPQVDMREAIRLEMSFGTRIFPPLMDAETAEHSPKEWIRLFNEGLKVFRDISDNEEFERFSEEALSGFENLGPTSVAYVEAKQRLISSGMSAERVEKMPVGQVMMVDTAREYRRIADEVEKWWYVPYQDFHARRHETKQLWQEDSSPFNTGRTIAHLLLPAVRAVRLAQMRSVWKKNVLLVIEALRMHAATTGSFPESLEQIQVVPVPLNPITTKPYLYHLDDETAVLELPFSDGMPGIAYRYEITLAKP